MSDRRAVAAALMLQVGAVSRSLGAFAEVLEEKKLARAADEALERQAEDADEDEAPDPDDTDVDECGFFIPVPEDLAGDFPRKSEDSSPPHVTLLYVGEVDWPTALAALVLGHAVARQIPAFDLVMEDYLEFESFEGRTIAAMIPRAAGGRLELLHDLLRSRLEEHGVEVQHRSSDGGFKPHVTLAYLEEGKSYDGPRPKGRWLVDRIEFWGFGRRIALPLKGAELFAASAGADSDRGESGSPGGILGDADPQRLANMTYDELRASLDVLTVEIAKSVMEGRSAEEAALRAYAQALRKAMLVADLIGRESVRERLERGRGAEPAEQAKPDFAPEEPGPRGASSSSGPRARRLADLLDLDADRLVREYARDRELPDAEQVRLLDRYSFGRAFTMAKASSEVIVDRAREILISSARAGTPTQRTAELVTQLSTNFTPAYAETVVRTNLVNAYSAGRHRAAADPDVASEVAGFEYMATRDSNVRPNHLAADGFFAPPGDPRWEGLTPPMGYNCRCGLRLVLREEMERRQMRFSEGVPQGAHPDKPGFGKRPEGY